MVPSADFIDVAFNAQGLAVSLVETVMISELENPPPEVVSPCVVIDSPLMNIVEKSRNESEQAFSAKI